MKIILLFAIMLTSTSVFSYDDRDDNYTDCESAIEYAMNSCYIHDDYDQENTYDTDCVEETMSEAGYTETDYGPQDSDLEIRAGYNDYVCYIN